MSSLRFNRILSICALALVPSALVGCAETGPYTWVDETPAPPVPDANDFRIKDGDVIHVRVFNQDNLQRDEKVRPDGKVTIPTVGEVMARGKKPTDLAKELEVKLKNVVVAPSVSVSVEPTTQVTICVLGEVRNPTCPTLDNGSGVLVALAAAGGTTDFASSDKIFVVRKGVEKRIRFRLSDLEQGDKRSVGFTMQVGDVVVVE
jgi:polysaccharide export outer membrane protein